MALLSWNAAWCHASIMTSHQHHDIMPASWYHTNIMPGSWCHAGITSCQLHDVTPASCHRISIWCTHYQMNTHDVIPVSWRHISIWLINYNSWHHTISFTHCQMISVHADTLGQSWCHNSIWFPHYQMVSVQYHSFSHQDSKLRDLPFIDIGRSPRWHVGQQKKFTRYKGGGSTKSFTFQSRCLQKYNLGAGLVILKKIDPVTLQPPTSNAKSLAGKY